MTPRHTRLRTTPRELRGQLAIFVVVLWTIGLINIATSRERLLGGRGTDFLHFYALASVGATDAREFGNSARVREAQLSAVPQSVDHQYPAVYGPQVAIALAPLARFTYGTALRIWFGLSAVLYFAAIAIVLGNGVVTRRYFATGMLAAAGFPPFWYLLQYGQLSSVAVLLVAIASVLLARGRGVAAGLALGLLVYKPPLFAPMLAIVLLSGSWSMSAAMVVSAAAEVAATVLWVGFGGLESYVQLMLRLPRMASLMAARPDQMHSFRAFWSLILGDSAAALVLYGVMAVAVMIAAAYVWRRVTDPAIRMATLLLGTVLASPHFYVYDLVILAPAWVWLADWYLSNRVQRNVGRILYVGYLAPLFGYLVTALPIQLSVLCYGYLLISVCWWARTVAASQSLTAGQGSSASSPEPLRVHELVPTGANTR